MIKLIIFLLLTITNTILLTAAIINGVRWGVCAVRHQDCMSIISVFKKNAVLLAGALILAAAFAFITQITAYTPAIRDSSGKVVEGSIAELRKITLNGRKEWITIRGTDRKAPILLFLAGGPGGSQLAVTRYELAELEKHFLVVNWDQPGSGKSYSCLKKNKMSVQTYIDDGIELTKYLLERFGQEQIYLLGESWGSALGVFLVHEKPEYYAGFIGTGQMVDFLETEIIDYRKAIEIAQMKGNEKLRQRLISQGEPPYYDGNVALKSALYLNYLSSYMSADSNITNGGYNTLREMFASEYGIIDSLRYLLGLMKTFNVIYPQLYETDLREDYSQLEVPVYFFIGRHDINAPVSLAEEYFNILDAPKKELVWFEHSGHNPYRNEGKLFVAETLRVFKGTGK